MKKIVIFGVGQAGQLAHYYFTRDAGRAVAGFTVDAAFLGSPAFCGLPVVPFEQVESVYPPADHDFFVAVGYAELNQLRARKADEAKAKGYALASYCSSRATVLTDEPVGENGFILEGSILQPFCRIGRNVTLWGARIGHHAVVADNCFIAGHVAGGVQVGPNCFVGLEAVLRNGITVGERSVIGAGALVLSHVAPSSVLVGAAAGVLPVPSHKLPQL